MNKTAALYARYSSDRQSDRSIADQIHLLRERAARDGFRIAGEWTDAAISGASTANRPGLLAMLDAAKAGLFARIYTEDLDRLSRGQGDTARMFERLSFVDVAIVTLSDGVVNEMHAGLKGTMNALFLKQLAAKTRRGQAGRVREGNIAGGLSYGYRPVAGQPGKRDIDEEQAVVVRRIFTAYAAGKGPRAIAAALNAEGVPGPRGQRWTDNVISGSVARHTGILLNPLYRGEIVWGRQRFVKDPDTGKRIARPVPVSEWLRAAAPEMRIVSDDLWRRVQARRDAGRRTGGRKRRQTRLLSGLTRCGCCGGSYIITGLARLGCANYKAAGTCTNATTVEYAQIEDRVLAGLRKFLLAPERVRAAVIAYRAAAAEAGRQARSAAMKQARRLGEITREEKRLVDAIAAGHAPAALVARLNALEVERKAIEADQASEEPQPVELHPQAAEQYAMIVETLQAALREETPGAAAARDIVRRMVTAIVLTPRGKYRGVDIDIRGDLAALMQREGRSGFRSGLVAGAGFEPATFRL